jgi:lysophospholipase L1-like esterase
MQRLVLVTSGLLVGLLLAEAGLRLVPVRALPESLAGFHELRPDRGWLYGLRPGARMTLRTGVHYEVNRSGFRDRDYARRKPAGVFRIVVLGDSVAFGVRMPDEHTFPSILEAALERRAPGRFEVLNMGVSGYNPYTEAELLADRGLAFAPDLVLVQFCSNDLNDPVFFFDEATSRTLGPLLPDAAFPDPAARRRDGAGRRRLVGCPRWLRLCRLAQAALLGPRRTGTLDDLRTATALHDGAADDGALRWLGGQYGRMAELARGRGARLVVALFPDRRQLERPDATALPQAIAARGREGGWGTIDLLPAFRAAGRPPRALLFDSWHLTAAGHAVAADALLRALACERWIPPVEGVACDGAPHAAVVPTS